MLLLFETRRQELSIKIILILLAIRCTDAKIYERCELVQELIYRHNLSVQEAGIWTCIAEGQSSYNTGALGGGSGSGKTRYHGIFQISDEYWCSPPGKGWVCGVSCDQLRDSDIEDDLACARNHIYQHHYQLSGDGFDAWPIYETYCKTNARRYTLGCDLKKKPNVAQYNTVTNIRKKNPPKYSGSGKIYGACELANELLYKHHIAADQIATWVCIAKHESGFNTSAINRGSGDYGLFQISELYWCGRNARGKACDMACSELLDEDIYDDVKCMMRIYDEHTRLQGDGFKAWTVYERNCKKDVSRYIDDCFKKGLKEPDEHLLVVYKRPSKTNNKYYQQETTQTTRRYVAPTYRTTTRATTRKITTTTTTTRPVSYNNNSNKNSYNKKQSKPAPVKKKIANPSNNLIDFYLQYFNNHKINKN